MFVVTGGVILRRMQVIFTVLLVNVRPICTNLVYYICITALTANDGRPETADSEVLRIQNGSPTPSLALTETDFGGRGEPQSGRSTLLRFVVTFSVVFLTQIVIVKVLT